MEVGNGEPGTVCNEGGVGTGTASEPSSGAGGRAGGAFEVLEDKGATRQKAVAHEEMTSKAFSEGAESKGHSNSRRDKDEAAAAEDDGEEDDDAEEEDEEDADDMKALLLLLSLEMLI